MIKDIAMQYNGWTNKETWLVNIWFNPMTREDVDVIENDLFSMINKAAPRAGILNDFLNMCQDEVNWAELKDAMLD